MYRRLIGFDVRQPKAHYLTGQWDEIARTRYLLRPTVPWPLSVDFRIWPSVFRSPFDQTVHGQSLPTIDLPEAHRHYDWQHLDRMRRYYDEHRASAPDGVFIAVEFLSEEEVDAEGTILYKSSDGIQCGLVFDPTTPASLPDGAVFLGYDIADAGRISGLANTEYTEPEIRDLAPVWSPRLNFVGLFDELDHAVTFRPLCDARDPVEAPYWIYGLWRLPFD